MYDTTFGYCQPRMSRYNELARLLKRLPGVLPTRSPASSTGTRPRSALSLTLGFFMGEIHRSIHGEDRSIHDVDRIV